MQWGNETQAKYAKMTPRCCRSFCLVVAFYFLLFKTCKMTQYRTGLLHSSFQQCVLQPLITCTSCWNRESRPCWFQLLLCLRWPITVKHTTTALKTLLLALLKQQAYIKKVPRTLMYVKQLISTPSPSFGCSLSGFPPHPSVTPTLPVVFFLLRSSICDLNCPTDVLICTPVLSQHLQIQNIHHRTSHKPSLQSCSYTHALCLASQTWFVGLVKSCTKFSTLR